MTRRRAWTLGTACLVLGLVDLVHLDVNLASRALGVAVAEAAPRGADRASSKTVASTLDAPASAPPSVTFEPRRPAASIGARERAHPPAMASASPTSLGTASTTTERADQNAGALAALSASPIVAPAPGIRPAAAPSVPLADGDVLAVFESGRTQTPELGAIVRVAGALRQAPDVKIVLQGYADPTGSPEFNARVSLERARWVRERLIELGVPASRVELAPPGSFGPGTSREGGPERRVELRVVGRD